MGNAQIDLMEEYYNHYASYLIHEFSKVKSTFSFLQSLLRSPEVVQFLQKQQQLLSQQALAQRQQQFQGAPGWSEQIGDLQMSLVLNRE